MKKRMYMLGLMLGLAAMATAPAYAEGEQLLGGYEAYEEAGVPEDVQEAFDQAMETFAEEGTEYTAIQLLGSQIVAGTNYRVLCERKSEEFGDAQSVVTIYKNLDGNCEVIEELKVIAPQNQPIDLGDIDYMSTKTAFTAADFNWEDMTLRFDVYQDALYDMVDMAKMELNNVVELDGNYIVVETMEDGEADRVTEEKTIERVATRYINEDTADEAFFIANEGGTWIAVGPNDHTSVIKVAEATLPISESLAFNDTTGNPGEDVEVAFADLQGYMQEKADAMSGNYGPYNTMIVVENNEIVSITCTWMP